MSYGYLNDNQYSSSQINSSEQKLSHQPIESQQTSLSTTFNRYRPTFYSFKSSQASSGLQASNIRVPINNLIRETIEGGINISSDCSCLSCSYGNNRPPQYQTPALPSSLPHSPWQQQSSYPSPHGQGGSQYYQQQQSFSQMPAITERHSNNDALFSNRYLPNTEERHEPIPLDPREWSSNDVLRWVQWGCATFKLRNLCIERFQMNGKALCLMDLSMFLYRVPDGGERLYHDFQSRLQRALCQDKFR